MYIHGYFLVHKSGEDKILCKGLGGNSWGLTSLILFCFDLSHR